MSDLKHFHNLLTKLEGGALAEELDSILQKCIFELSDACLDRGGEHKASITVKLDLRMNHRDKVVEIYPIVSEKLPKAPRGRGGLYYCNAEGELVRENPRQLTIDDELEKQRLQNAEQAISGKR